MRTRARAALFLDAHCRRRILGALVFAALIASGPVRADAFDIGMEGVRAATVSSVRQAWTWQVQRSQLPLSLGPVSGIPAGDIAIAWIGEPDKIGYLDFPWAVRTLAGSRLELVVDGAATNENVETAALRACVIMSEWEPAEPIAWDRKPISDCDRGVPGVYVAKGSVFRFDLTPLSASLLSPAAQGVSIEPAETPVEPFQVAFKGATKGGVRLVPPSTAISPSAPAAPRASHGDPPLGPQLPRTPKYERGADAEPTREQAALATAARPSASPQLPRARPFGLGGVYAVLVVLAALPLAGCAASQLLAARKEA